VLRSRIARWLPRTIKVRLSLAVAAAIALGSVATAVASAGTTDTVTITSVTPSTNPGQLTISVTSDTALTALKVTLASVTNPDALSFTLADFTEEAGGSDTSGTYQLASPIIMSELPTLGTYAVEVGAVDSGGGVATDNDSSLNWVDQPAITLTASQTTFSYASPSISFSGTLGLTYPDGTADTTTSVSGQPLTLTDSQGSSSAITTGTGGAYQVTVGQPDNNAAYEVSFVATLTIAGATSNDIDVSAVQDPAAVTARASATQLNYGRDLTISGTAGYNPGSGDVPLATDSTVEIFSGPYSSTSNPTPFITTTTNTEGDYGVTFPDRESGGPWYVYAGGLPGSSFLDEVLTLATAETATVNVAYPVSITGLRASLSSFAVLTLTGCLSDSNSGKGYGLPLRVEYAARRTGPWHVLKTVQGTTAKRCGTGPDYGSTFEYRVPVAVAAAYYRLSYPGSSAYQSAATRPVYEAKVLTKITNFVISRHTVARDGTVTVSGRLWKDTKGWQPFSRQKVFIEFLYKGVWYYFPHKPVTSSSGSFRGTFKAYVTAPWIAEYIGSSAYFACASARVDVRVTGTRSAQVLGPAAWPARPFAGEVLADTQVRLAD
jgi:hypothetical protein